MTGRFSRLRHVAVGVALAGFIVTIAVDETVGVVIFAAGMLVAAIDELRLGQDLRNVISAVLFGSLGLLIVSDSQDWDTSFWIGIALIAGSAVMLLFDEYMRPHRRADR